MQDVIIVRYGEIGIKSPAVRRLFEKILISNIGICLRKNKMKYDKIEQSMGRVYVFSKNTKALEKIRNVFGIVSISPSRMIETDIELIKKDALACYKSAKKKSFRITANRLTKDFNLNSQKICEIVGEYVQEKTGAKVNLSKPDININVEINGKNAFVFYETIRGFGGLPIGTQGKVLCIISDEKSSIAALEMLRRGCTTHLLFVGNKKLIDKSMKLLNKYYIYREPLLYSNIENDDLVFNNATKLAASFGAIALCSGEIHIENVRKLPKQDLLLIFPLIGFDKSELTELANSFGIKLKQ